MSYANAIRDIPPRSTWIAKDGTRALVVRAAAAHVTFTRVSPIVPRPLLTPAETLHEREFRARFAPVYDRAHVRSQFSMSCANLGEFRVYWLPAPLSRIMCRSISCVRHFAVPEGALLVGTYAAPCTAAQFLDDLDDLLANLPATIPNEAAA